MRVICRVPWGFEIPMRLFEAQVAVLGRASMEGGRTSDAEVTDLVGLPSFRANPELVTFLVGSGSAETEGSVAQELLAIDG